MAHAGKYGIIAHDHVPSHLCVVAHDAVIANDAVVRHVAVSHDQAVIAHLGRPAVFTTPVDGHKLADRGVVADLHGGILAFVFEILRNTGDHRTGGRSGSFCRCGRLP